MEYSTKRNAKGGFRFDITNLPAPGAELVTESGEVVMFDEVGMAGMLVCTRKNLMRCVWCCGLCSTAKIKEQRMIFGLTKQTMLGLMMVAIIGIIALPGLAKFGCVFGCVAFAARKQCKHIKGRRRVPSFTFNQIRKAGDVL